MRQGIVISDAGYFHSASALVSAEARRCAAFVRDGKNLSRWLAGNPAISRCGQGFYKITNAESGFVRIESHGDNVIYFHVGTDPDRLQRRIMIAIHDGPSYGGMVFEGSEQTCLVNLIAWRMADMTDRRWQDLCACHEEEIRTLKQALQQPR